MLYKVRATCQGTREQQGREGVGWLPRALLCKVHTEGIEGGRGQRNRRPETLQPGTRGRASRERASRQGAGQGQGGGAERGGREGALPRELIRTVLALAGGRGSEMAGQGRGRAARGPAYAHCMPQRLERANMGQGQRGAPRPSEPPAARGGTGQGGAPWRAATRQPAPKGAVCCVPV